IELGPRLDAGVSGQRADPSGQLDIIGRGATSGGVGARAQEDVVVAPVEVGMVVEVVGGSANDIYQFDGHDRRWSAVDGVQRAEPRAPVGQLGQGGVDLGPS